MKVLKLVIAVGALSLVAGGSTAQQMQECAKDGSCVEFTVRYTRNADPYKRIQILDPQTKKPLDTKTSCYIGKDCKFNNVQDVSSITLMQTYNPHYCYQSCTGGWCFTKCPSH